jgi:hypothetical protein
VLKLLVPCLTLLCLALPCQAKSPKHVTQIVASPSHRQHTDVVNGVTVITSTQDNASVSMYPSLAFSHHSDRIAFNVVITNNSDDIINFDSGLSQIKLNGIPRRLMTKHDYRKYLYRTMSPHRVAHNVEALRHLDNSARLSTHVTQIPGCAYNKHCIISNRIAVAGHLLEPQAISAHSVSTGSLQASSGVDPHSLDIIEVSVYIAGVQHNFVWAKHLLPYTSY